MTEVHKVPSSILGVGMARATPAFGRHLGAWVGDGPSGATLPARPRRARNSNKPCDLRGGEKISILFYIDAIPYFLVFPPTGQRRSQVQGDEFMGNKYYWHYQGHSKLNEITREINLFEFPNQTGGVL